jgi:alkylated DNA repair dioxygenase AlkB
MESFMAKESLTYGYDTKEGVREYSSVGFTKVVEDIMLKLNSDFGTEYNVCFLNYYRDKHQHLGWHSDDSPSMDNFHPIAVISFGEPRYIYTKDKGFKGVIPPENKYLLTNGSLFTMPERYQENHYHKIPKGDREMGGRISLTFRKYIKS